MPLIQVIEEAYDSLAVQEWMHHSRRFRSSQEMYRIYSKVINFIQIYFSFTLLSCTGKTK